MKTLIMLMRYAPLQADPATNSAMRHASSELEIVAGSACKYKQTCNLILRPTPPCAMLQGVTLFFCLICVSVLPLQLNSAELN